MSAPSPSSTPRFVPYIAPDTALREFTWRGVLAGSLLGMVFGASSLYLVLKVGLTVSASIPVAVISITLFKALTLFRAKDATILENNIVQTAGSAGESIAFGVGVTMPAILILGFDLSQQGVGALEERPRVLKPTLSQQILDQRLRRGRPSTTSDGRHRPVAGIPLQPDRRALEGDSPLRRRFPVEHHAANEPEGQHVRAQTRSQTAQDGFPGRASRL